jgi:hypothetical protein
MLKVMLCARRHPSMTRPEFYDYLRNKHAPLVKSVPVTVTALLRYNQNHLRAAEDGVTAATLYRRAEERDSVIELCFESLATMDALTHDPDYLATIRPDEARFNDLSSLIVVLTTETPVFGAAADAGPWKAIDFVKRRAGLTREAFVEAWRGYGAELAEDAAYRAVVNRRVHDVALQGDASGFSEAAAFDGVAESWVRDFEQYGALTERLRRAEHAFIDPDASFSVFAQQVPILDQIG